MIKFSHLTPLLVAAGLGLCGSAFAGQWTVVPETSSVGFTGTQQGKMFGVEPTGRPVSVTMMAFFRFADGRIAELWEDYDEHGLRQQLTRPAQSD